MSTHTPFIRRIVDLTRNGAVVWSQSAEAPEFVSRVDNYTARLAFAQAARPGVAPGLRFSLYDRDDKVVEVGARSTADFQSSDDSAQSLRALHEAVQRQLSSRETAVFEDFLSRVEA